MDATPEVPEGEEMENEMAWRLDEDAMVEGGRFQWGWERYTIRYVSTKVFESVALVL